MSKTMVPMDGNEAAAHIAYAFTEIAAIYPITPSSPMAEFTDAWSANGRKNLFGQPVTLVEMQSEAGAIGAVHGASEAGALATSFTSSQGLMLMIPVMYRIAGTKQPVVLQVAARTVGTHAMSIFGDHSDVMACRSTGFAMMNSGSVQEVMDLAAIAHLAAVKARIPFMHFFDGFRTSHEIQKIEKLEYDELKTLVDWDAIARFKDEALNPEHPTLRNTVQNPDVYFQVREANNSFYDAMPGIVEEYMQKINALTGRNYGLFNYYGAPDADRVIVAMGSVSGTIKDTIDYLNAKGEKTGYVQVHLFRPFSVKHFMDCMPKTVKKVAVLDRCKEAGAVGEPLYLDVCSAFFQEENKPLIVGGRYGLSSKDTDPAQIKAVFDNLKQDKPKNHFTIGIVDDVTGHSLPLGEFLNTDPEGTISCKFWGLGSDGTVGANKNSIKIISEYTNMYTQGYFEYDTKKSFGVTRSHLRFGKAPIRGTQLVKRAQFVACHNQFYLDKYDIINELVPGGVFLLNCDWSEAELGEKLPGSIKKYIAENDIHFYIINANKISQEVGLGNLPSSVLQAAFFKVANIIPVDDAVKYMKDAIRKTFAMKGEDVVNKNLAAIDGGLTGLIEIKVPAEWKNAEVEVHVVDETEPPVIKNILRPLTALKGDDLPVSSFKGYEDGTMPLGITAYEKRGIATAIPSWNSEKCIQCNLCSYVCPHAVIRPYLLDAAEAANAPAGFNMVPAKGKEGKDYQFAIQVSALDCTACGNCAAICPTNSLEMTPAKDYVYDAKKWEYALSLTEKNAYSMETVKGSQFKQPLVEFSGACAGCGETLYAKLLTQLFGDRVYWANGTGCSQAWAAAMPSVAYTTNKEGRGPAWSNSLFEDNAEFSLGMCLAVKQQRKRVRMHVEELMATLPDGDAVKTAAEGWIADYNSSIRSRGASDALLAALEAADYESRNAELKAEILTRKDQLAKKTIWMYGGDGWAYDIGYGGLDHVFATGEDLNVFDIDTEVYSNTGGQSSKATPLGAAAQFQASGKKTKKKDLGKLMMAYGNVYVAQVAMGANPNQLIKALIEADNHPGPSLVIGYTPCITHGIRRGMKNMQQEMKRAVEAGYWYLYRYNPDLPDHKFKLDSKEPNMSYEDFLDGENRYAALRITFPENARTLFAQAAEDSKKKYQEYKDMEDK